MVGIVETKKNVQEVAEIIRESATAEEVITEIQSRWGLWAEHLGESGRFYGTQWWEFYAPEDWDEKEDAPKEGAEPVITLYL